MLPTPLISPHGKQADEKHAEIETGKQSDEKGCYEHGDPLSFIPS
jgi:hypothetical protein